MGLSAPCIHFIFSTYKKQWGFLNYWVFLVVYISFLKRQMQPQLLLIILIACILPLWWFLCVLQVSLPPLSVIKVGVSGFFGWLTSQQMLICQTWESTARLLNAAPFSGMFSSIRAHFACWCWCTAELSGGEPSDRIFASDPSAKGRQERLDCVHTWQTAD